MKKVIRCFFSLLVVFSTHSCGIFGVHFKDHNPRHQSKYPDFDPETILLGELSPVRKNFDVTYYDLDIMIDPVGKKIGGWVELTAIALSDIDSIQIDLDQPLGISELRWESRDGLRLNYSRNYRAVLVKLPYRVTEGNLFSVCVKYEGNPILAHKPPWRGGVVWKKDKQKYVWAGVTCESEGASIWFPCKDHTSDEPDSATLKFTSVDTSVLIVSNGRLINDAISNQGRSFIWKVSYPINVYNITFYLGNFEKISDTLTGINGKIIQLNNYVLKPNAEKAKKHFQSVKNIIKVNEGLYGEYPWYNDGFKLVESPYAGMEHQTAIAYGNGFKNDLYQKEDYIMLHEVGHEWFGNAVTAADFADIWLQEGFTTYGEVLYLEKTYGKDLAKSHLNTYRLFIKNKRPLVGPVDRRYFNFKDGDAYVKGAWILHTLRYSINNDSLFFNLLKTFYAENKYRLTDSKSFIELVNKSTGKDYQWFFDQYLYKNKIPCFEGFFEDRTLYYRWTDVENGFNKLVIKIKLGGKTENYEIYPDTNIQKLVFSKPDEAKASELSINTNDALIKFRKNENLARILLQQQEASVSK